MSLVCVKNDVWAVISSTVTKRFKWLRRVASHVLIFWFQVCCLLFGVY